jgi:hypothetical protein
VTDIEDIEDEPPSKRPSKKSVDADAETPAAKSKKALADVVSAWSKDD